MDLNLLFFLILAVVAIASAVAMLLSRSAIYAALFLILNFATVAVFYLLLNAVFIAMTQVTVYAGAIMVLFLFVIMLLGAEHLSRPNALPWQRPLAFILGLVLLGEAVYILVNRTTVTPVETALASDFGSPIAVGYELFTQYLLPFEVTSILLLVAMVGVIVLTKVDRKKK